jgi:hypothetical protein
MAKWLAVFAAGACGRKWPVTSLVAEPKFGRDRVDSGHRTTTANRSFVTLNGHRRVTTLLQCRRHKFGRKGALCNWSASRLAGPMARINAAMAASRKRRR